MDTSPISPSSPQLPAQAQGANVPLMAQQMQNNTLDLAAQLQNVKADPSLSADPECHQRIVSTIGHLNSVVEASLKLT